MQAYLYRDGGRQWVQCNLAAPLLLSKLILSEVPLKSPPFHPRELILLALPRRPPASECARPPDEVDRDRRMVRDFRRRHALVLDKPVRVLC